MPWASEHGIRGGGGGDEGGLGGDGGGGGDVGGGANGAQLPQVNGQCVV